MAEKELRTMAQGLVLIAVILAIIAIGVWIRPSEVTRVAGGATPTTDRSVAGIPDSGLQRQVMIEELRRLNDRLAVIEEGLKEGRFQIQTLEPKEGGGKEAGKAR